MRGSAVDCANGVAISQLAIGFFDDLVVLILVADHNELLYHGLVDTFDAASVRVVSA